MSLYNHRAHGTSAGHPSVARITDLLDTLKSEYDTLFNEVSLGKRQREEQEQKIQSYIGDLVKLQENVDALELRYRETVKTYEDEIMRLRSELKQAGIVSNSPATQHQPLLGPLALSGPPTKRPRQDEGQVNGSSTPTAQQASVSKVKIQSQTSGGSSPAAVPTKPLQTPAFASESHGPEYDIESKTKGDRDWSYKFNQRFSFSKVDLLHSVTHKSVVCCVKFSTDGKYLATGSNRAAQVFDINSGKLASEIIESGDREPSKDLYIRSVSFNPDATLLATGAEDKLIRIYDIRTRALRQTLKGHEHEIYSLDFTRCGRFIVSGSGDKRVNLWDVETGRCTMSVSSDDDPMNGGDSGITSVALSSDMNLIGAGALDEIVRVFDIRTRSMVNRFSGHDDSVYSVAFSPDGKYIVSGSLDKTLRLWDLASTSQAKNLRMVFRGHTDYVLSVAFSPDGNSIVSGSKDRSVRFWDPKTGGTIMKLQGHTNSVISVAMAQKRNLFATGSGDMMARIWSYS